MNYAEYDPFNYFHRIKENVMVTMLVRKSDAERAQQSVNLLHSQLLVSAIQKAEQNTFSQIQNNLMALHANINNYVAPWIDWTKYDSADKVRTAVGIDLQKRWESIFGKIDSKEVQQKLAVYERNNEKRQQMQSLVEDGTWIN